MATITLDKRFYTLEAVDQKIVEAQDSLPRNYLGMSAIGDSCMRKLWYSFRWVANNSFDALSLKRFDDGHRGEDIQAERLRLVESIALWTHDENGGQFGAKEHNGHFKGHADGFIKGILEAPETWHVWEHKQSADKKQRELVKLINADEKTALEKWNGVYYAQAVLYMHYFEMSRHYLTCATPGGRQSVSVRTNENKEKAKSLIDRALLIIRSQVPLPKLSESPAWFECKWCDYRDLCHGKQLPNINCRTCCHATPELEGEPGRWSCKKHGTDITPELMPVGCDQHLMIPALLQNHVEATDADAVNLTWVDYKESKTGEKLRNGEGGMNSETLIKHLEIPF